MAFTLPNLPYETNALEPFIDTMTMEIHHGRHHKAYVDNLNKALEGQAALQSKSIEQLLREVAQVPDTIRQAVINNGGGHANHAMFWEIMAGGAGGKPTGPLADDIQVGFHGSPRAGRSAVRGTAERLPGHFTSQPPTGSSLVRSARREGISIPESHREYANTIVSTGSCIGVRACPYPTGTVVGGNHKSHCAISPAS